MDYDAVYARLTRLVAADDDPALTLDELDDLMSRARRADPAGNLPTNTSSAGAWPATTPVLVGRVVRSSSPVRYWRAALSGVTGTTAPSWPVLSLSAVTETTVVDGEVVWQDVGGEWAPTWDVEAAAADGWRTKAAKAAGRFDFEEDGQRFSRNQIIAHCKAMAESFEKRTPGTLTVSGV